MICAGTGRLACPDGVLRVCASCRCLSPAGQGPRFLVRVTVGGLTDDAPTLWTFDPPSVLTVEPRRLAPVGGQVVTIAGSSFGADPSAVSVSFGTSPCPVLSVAHTFLTCVAPPGVATAVAVHVRVSGVPSVPVPASPSAPHAAHYGPPVVLSASLQLAGTLGGEVLAVGGANFSAPAAPVSVWLSRGGPVMAPAPSPSQFLVCDVVATGVDTVTCVVPPGAGIGWQVYVVNNGSGAGLAGFQSSAPSGLVVSYLPPTVSAARVVSTGGTPARGGYVLRVDGANLYTTALVTVGGLPCPVTACNHTWLQCTGPPLRVHAPPVVDVSVDGQRRAPSEGAEFVVAYDPPVVTVVTPALVDAQGTADRPPVTVRGLNFGDPAVDVAVAPDRHSVSLGPLTCATLVWVDDATVLCTLPPTPVQVGVYNVTVSVNNVASAHLHNGVRFSCRRGFHGAAGELCAPCPTGGECPGDEVEPYPRVGYFRTAPRVFVPCTPRESCLGGVNSTCGAKYTGVRCAACVTGAYRCGLAFWGWWEEGWSALQPGGMHWGVGCASVCAAVGCGLRYSTVRCGHCVVCGAAPARGCTVRRRVVQGAGQVPVVSQHGLASLPGPVSGAGRGGGLLGVHRQAQAESCGARHRPGVCRFAPAGVVPAVRLLAPRVLACGLVLSRLHPTRPTHAALGARACVACVLEPGAACRTSCKFCPCLRRSTLRGRRFWWTH